MTTTPPYPPLIGYARVSTIDQHPELQLDALTNTGCLKIFTDTASGKTDSRPELDRMLDQLRPGDTVVVWRLDRLGRSIAHLIELTDHFADRGVEFCSLTEGIDTTTPGGRLVFHIFAALAQFEREIIVERTRAGLAAARARGRGGGRPLVMTPAKLGVARQLHAAHKLTLAQIAATISVSRSTLIRHLSRC